MFTTKRLYEEDPSLMTCTAQVLDVMSEGDLSVVILDQTVFHPQAPASAQGFGVVRSDIGLIESETGRFNINSVELREDHVRHLGTFESEPFEVAETVTCTVSEEFQKEIETNKID